MVRGSTWVVAGGAGDGGRGGRKREVCPRDAEGVAELQRCREGRGWRRREGNYKRKGVVDVRLG